MELIGIVQHTETAEHTFGLTCVEYFNGWSLPSSAGQIKAMIVISECYWHIKDSFWFNTCDKRSVFWQYFICISSETETGCSLKGRFKYLMNQWRANVFLKWQSLTNGWLTASPKMSAALFKQPHYVSETFWCLHLSCAGSSSCR